MWKVPDSRYPYKTYGHCTVLSKDGQNLHSSGGWSDGNPENLKSAFTLLLDKNFVWKKVPSMKVGRATHACLATKFGVSQGLL